MPNPNDTASPMAATVLIAEDSPTQAEQLRWLLEQNGFTVVAAARDGEEALGIAKATAPTAIVSDVVMPKMDGYQLCRAVKADPKLKSIGVILVTALSGPDDVLNGLAAGADNFLTKPYPAEQLVSRLRHLLDNIAETERAERGIRRTAP